MFKSIVLTALLSASAAEASLVRRELSYEAIVSYEPGTSVTDHNAIDLDQKAMEDQLGKRTSTAFSQARNIYEKGGNSKSVARITPATNTLTIQVNDKAEVTGDNTDGTQIVTGTAMDTYPIGSTTMDVQYTTSDVQASYSTCRVGGLVDTVETGCFAPTGAVVTPSGTVEYAALENINLRTLQGFSAAADSKMRVNGEGEYYADFQKFVDYYGAPDYADKFVKAALNGDSASLKGKTFSFNDYDMIGRAEAIKKGTAYMATAMYVIRELEDALDDCAFGTPKRNDDAVHALDEAVAFYSGSLEDGSGSGVQMYALAEKRCKDYKTCGANGNSLEGQSKVNAEIFKEFGRMQKLLARGNKCDEARVIKERIVNKMFVPLIQGTLRYAWKLQNEVQTDDKAEAEGATFAAAVLPMVNACSPTDASTIFSNMRPGSGTPDFAKVKKAFERNYGCLKVSCADIGGLYDDGQYLQGASPCGGAGSSSSSSSNVNIGLAVGLSVGLFAALVFVCCFCKRRKASTEAAKSEIEFKSESTDPDNHQI